MLSKTDEKLTKLTFVLQKKSRRFCQVLFAIDFIWRASAAALAMGMEPALTSSTRSGRYAQTSLAISTYLPETPHSLPASSLAFGE
jgi:hypothetical protein